MSEDKLRLFEFRPDTDVPDPDSSKQNSPGQSSPGPDDAPVELIGDAPLTLEEDSRFAETRPLQEPEQEEAPPPVLAETRSGPPPRYTPFVFESANGSLLFQEGRVRIVDGQSVHAGFVLLVKDFDASPGLGVLHLQGASRYADVLARKKLEELGELSVVDQLLLYEVRRGRGRDFSVLYQVVRRDSLRAVEQRCRNHAGGMQYADTLGLLRGVLFRLPGSSGTGGQPVRACALRLPGALLLLVADHRRVALARRYPFMEGSPGSLSGCLAALRRDVDAACAAGTPVPVRLVETGVPLGQEALLASCAAGQRGFELLPPWVLEQERGGVYVSVLPELVRLFPSAQALGPRAERWVRPLERCEKLLWGLLAAGICLCWAIGWHARLQQQGLEARTAALRQELRQAAPLVDLPRLPRLPRDAFSQRAALAEVIDRARSSPSLADVWNRLGAAKPGALSLTHLRVRYLGGVVEVALQGRLYAGLRASQELARDFLERLRAGGAAIREHDLQLNDSGEQDFSLVLEYAGRAG